MLMAIDYDGKILLAKPYADKHRIKEILSEQGFSAFEYTIWKFNAEEVEF